MVALPAPQSSIAAAVTPCQPVAFFNVKRSDSGLRGGTLRFDLLDFRLYLRELCDESLTRRGRGGDIRKRFFVRSFHGVGGHANATVLSHLIRGIKYIPAKVLTAFGERCIHCRQI